MYRAANYVLTGSPWDPWTKPWNMLLDLLGDDQYFLYVYGWSHIVLTGIKCLLLCSGTTIVTTVFFWIAASGYMFVDLTGRPAFIFKWVTMPQSVRGAVLLQFVCRYKIQPEKNAPLEMKKLMKVVRHVLVNQVYRYIGAGNEVSKFNNLIVNTI